MSGRTSAVVAGACGALLIAYCIYFDRKRRSDPQYKKKLRERKLARQATEGVSKVLKNVRARFLKMV